ncbi:lysophospholipase L1-like esterase [Psychrobacillus insolitus]|uniref:Lysophospholipase L1-like esterase n=1 Tax=Psychrobacillus insolitus TaxID=1461 RepID=A0A2W7MRU7_9BACI|nr:SGNH/GDSL hydrolase family protein [Psychrobacillus insolitus]PZX07894.1 lysophospholipase L1-like esterase [Psychrobacillus insolitus]
MPLNTFQIKADIKKPILGNEPTVTSSDDILFVVSILDAGEPVDLTGVITCSLVHTRLDGAVIVTDGTIQADGKIHYKFGTSETAVPGQVKAVAQLYSADERVSTIAFTYKVAQDSTGDGYVPSITEQTLIQVVMSNAQAKIDELSQVNVVDLKAQLADKANQAEVRKNTDALPINVSEMDTETKSLFTGGAVAVVGEYAVGMENVKPKAINHEKTTFLSTGKNLFDKSNVMPNKYIGLDGKLLDSTTDFTSMFINVSPNDVITISTSQRVGLYDINQAPVTVLNNGPITTAFRTLTVPANVHYIRANSINSSLNTFQIERGDTATAFEPYHYKMKSLVVEGIGNISELPVSSSIVDNLKIALSAGFTVLSPNLPTTISKDAKNKTAILLINGQTAIETTVVSKTRNEFNLKGITPILTNVTQTKYGNGIQLSGALGSEWWKVYSNYLVILKPNTKYTLSAKASNSKINALASGVIIYDGVDTTASLGTHRNTNNPTITFTTTASGSINLRFYLDNETSSGTNVETKYFDIMLAESATALPYVDYLNETYTIPPVNSSFAQVVNIIPNTTITNPDGLLNSITTVNIPSSSTMIAVNGQAPDENGDISIVIPKSQIDGKTVVSFGDSIFGNYSPPVDISTFISENTGSIAKNVGFGGCRMSSHHTHWDAFCMYRLADAITSKDFSLQNQAIISGSGESVPLGNRLPTYFPTRLETLKGIDFNKTEIITIAYGQNDYTAIKLLDNTENPYDIHTYKGALRYSLEKILTTYPHIKIMVLSPIYCFWLVDGVFDQDSDTRKFGDNVLPDLVQAAKEVCLEYKTPYLDNYYDLGFNKFNRTSYFSGSDGIHPNSAGRKRIGEKVASQLISRF